MSHTDPKILSSIAVYMLLLFIYLFFFMLTHSLYNSHMVYLCIGLNPKLELNAVLFGAIATIHYRVMWNMAILY